MDAAIQRLYASQSSTNLTSQNGVRYLQSGYDVARKWLVDELGYKDVDINAQADDKTKVFGHPIFDYSNGQRGGPVTTYLQTALQYENFHLEPSTQVLRVEREGDLATGVIAMVNGSETFVALTPTGRVIASGGALQSPSLLMHSGIGDPATLTSLQAAGKLSRNLTSNDWINSTSVGAGLFDNPNTFIELQGPAVEAYFYSYDNPSATDKQLYLDSRSGPYATAGQTSVFWTTITHDDNSVTGCK